MEETGNEGGGDSKDFIGGKVGGNKVLDENNNVNVCGFSPPSCKLKNSLF